MTGTPAANSTFAIGGFRAPHTVLWLKKVLCSALTFVVKIPPIANLQNVMPNAMTTVQQTNIVA
jgi:hypothetical protein